MNFWKAADCVRHHAVLVHHHVAQLTKGVRLFFFFLKHCAIWHYADIAGQYGDSAGQCGWMRKITSVKIETSNSNPERGR